MGVSYRIMIVGRLTNNTRLRAEKIKETDQIVQFRVYGRDRSIVMQSCYPLFKARGLTRKKPVWQLVEGNLSNQYFLESLGKALTDIVKHEDDEAFRINWHKRK